MEKEREREKVTFHARFFFFVFSVFSMMNCKRLAVYSLEFVFNFFQDLMFSLSAALVLMLTARERQVCAVVCCIFILLFVDYSNMGLIIITAKHFKLLKWGACKRKDGERVCVTPLFIVRWWPHNNKYFM